MLDIKLIKEQTGMVKAALLKRMAPENLNLEKIISLDSERRRLLKITEDEQAHRNALSKEKPTPEIIAQLKTAGVKNQQITEELNNVEAELNLRLGELPNIPDEDVVAGGKENNQVVYTHAQAPTFDFPVRNHIELADKLKLIDYERAVKMSGSGFWAYTGAGALLEWALLSYFIDFHSAKGYRFIIPPFMLSEKSAFISGHLPKFREDLFWTQDDLCLTATSEMMLGNYHSGEILSLDDLPMKYFAYSPCFRREGGGYRQEERGMIRGHQFNKVEMFILCRPEESAFLLEELKNNVIELSASLDLHFQLSKLAAGDCSDAMVKTYDLEIFFPSLNIYKEISSISSAGDYQARRGHIRYKNPQTNKNEFVHTLNASGLATSRLFPAILEQHQQADGSVAIPSALQKYFPAGMKKISPIN